MSAGKLCECGCGSPAPIAKKTDAERGRVLGQPLRFVHGHSQRTAAYKESLNRTRRSYAGDQNPSWKGGKVRMKGGYIGIKMPGHAHANPNGYVLEHVLIASQALGRPLPAGVEVHHVNENTTHNQGKNLVICQDHAYHMLLHARARKFRARRAQGVES